MIEESIWVWALIFGDMILIGWAARMAYETLRDDLRRRRENAEEML